MRADFQREMHAVDEEDTIAEDDLVVQNEVEQPSKTPEEIREAAEAKKEYALSVAKDKSGQLRALVYWITRGGTFPDDWELPPKAKMEELKVDGFRDLLGDLHGEDVSDVFASEWEKDADLYNRVTVFSKVGSLAALADGSHIVLIVRVQRRSWTGILSIRSPMLSRLTRGVSDYE